MADPTPQDIEKVISAKEKAEKETEYANSIKMDVQYISGTRYKFRFSEEDNR